MPHSRSSVLIVGLVILTTGCAFEEGQPWGVASFDVTASFDPPASRLDGGALKTAKDYRVQIDELTVELASIELEIATSGEAGSFDPANPPPGYNLCHNGHCHAADGSLVDYEEIEVAQSGGDFVVSQAIDAEVALAADPRTVDLGECSAECHLERGALGVVRLRISGIRLIATVTDIRDRLSEPVAIDLDAPLDVALAAPIDGEIGTGEPGAVDVATTFEMPAGFLDGVDFAAPSTLETSIAEAIQQQAALDVDVERSDL